MAFVGSSCLLLLVATSALHCEVLRLLTVGLPVLRMRPQGKLIVVIVGAFGAHASEIVLYAVAYYFLATYLGLGGMGQPGPLTFTRCLSCSAEPDTALGYGDVVPHGELRLLAGMEAVNGLLLIGWTRSVTDMSMERFWHGKKIHCSARKTSRMDMS